MGGVAVNDIQLWNSRTREVMTRMWLVQTTKRHQSMGLVIRCITKMLLMYCVEKQPETDGREGLKSLELLIAAYLSARDGRTIALPFEY